MNHISVVDRLERLRLLRTLASTLLLLSIVGALGWTVYALSDDTTKSDVSLDKVARFINLLAADGARPLPGDVVAGIHGKATPIAMDNAAYRTGHNGVANPNLELIDRLRKLGASVRVCSQTLAAASIAPEACRQAGPD